MSRFTGCGQSSCGHCAELLRAEKPRAMRSVLGQFVWMLMGHATRGGLTDDEAKTMMRHAVYAAS